MKIWSLFIEEKNQISRWGFDRLNWGSTCWLAISILCLAGDRWTSIGSQLDFDQTSTGPWSVEVWIDQFLIWLNNHSRRERMFFLHTLTGWTGGQPAPRPVELAVDQFLIWFNRLSCFWLNNQFFQFKTF